MKKSSGALIVILALMISTAVAQPYSLPWNSFNAGGRPGSGTNLRLNGSIAQPVQGAGAGAPGYLGWWGFWFGDFRRDAGVTTILAPINQVDTLPLTPRATVKNFGQLPEASITVYCRILYGGLPVYTGTTTVTNVAPNGTATATFPAYGGHHALGDYTIRCSTDWRATPTVTTTLQPVPLRWSSTRRRGRRLDSADRLAAGQQEQERQGRRCAGLRQGKHRCQ